MRACVEDVQEAGDMRFSRRVLGVLETADVKAKSSASWPISWELAFHGVFSCRNKRTQVRTGRRGQLEPIVQRGLSKAHLLLNGGVMILRLNY